MVCKEFVILCLFVCHVKLITATIYSCNQTADCGCSKTNANVYKIVGGEDAYPSSWGWAVSFQIGGEHFCTGSIVSPRYIVTAAHCFPDEFYKILASAVVGIDRLDVSGLAYAQVRSIKTVVLHPGYNSLVQLNDIAVVELNESLTISNDMSTARLCLPRIEPSSGEIKYPIDSVSLVAIGWGVLQFGAPSIPDDLHLQQVTVHAVAVHNETCKEFITNASTQFCAGVDGGGKDTCQGDSGGPLMRFEPAQKRWVLAGVTSFGLGCADPRYSGVYTRVSAYRGWLQEVTGGELKEAFGSLESVATENYYNIFSILFSVAQLFLFH